MSISFITTGLLTTEQAAKMLNLSATTLTTWRCRGGGPRYVRAGRLVRYARVDLEAWVKTRRFTNTSESSISGGDND